MKLEKTQQNSLPQGSQLTQHELNQLTEFFLALNEINEQIKEEESGTEKQDPKIQSSFKANKPPS